MGSDTFYENRVDGAEAIPFAVEQISAQIMAANPVRTIEHGLFHSSIAPSQKSHFGRLY